MGNKSAKKTNQLLAEQTRRANQIGDVAGGRSEEIYRAGRGDIDWGRGELKNLYSSLGSEDGGDGGGEGYTPAIFESSTLPFYLKMMREGAFDERERGAIESSATAPISGIFEGLKRNLNTMAAGRGGGYGSGLGRLARDQAYAASDASKSAFADIAKMVAESKLAGAAGATPIESEKRAFEAQERSNARAAAARGRASADADLDTKRSLINQILGLESDKDLAYMDRQLGAGGLATGTITSRADETPLWQKGLASVLPSVAGSAVGAFTGGYKKKVPYTETAGYKEAMTPVTPYTFKY